MPFWLRIHPRAWLILNRKLQEKFIKLIKFWWGSLHESVHLTCLEQKALCEVLWLTCFILNKLLSAAVKKLKISHLKLSICFKSVSVKLTPCDFILVSYFFGKNPASVTHKAEFLRFNTTLSHIYLKLHQQNCYLLLKAELWVWVIICYVKQREHNLIFQLISLKCSFNFTLVIEI